MRCMAKPSTRAYSIRNYNGISWQNWARLLAWAKTPGPGDPRARPLETTNIHWYNPDKLNQFLWDNWCKNEPNDEGLLTLPLGWTDGLVDSVLGLGQRAPGKIPSLGQKKTELCSDILPLPRGHWVVQSSTFGCQKRLNNFSKIFLLVTYPPRATQLTATSTALLPMPTTRTFLPW